VTTEVPDPNDVTVSEFWNSSPTMTKVFEDESYVNPDSAIAP